MASNITLSAKLRTEDFGSAGSRRLLRAGSIPAVIYGKEAPVHIILDAREFGMKRSNFSESTLILLNVDGKEHNVFVKTYQESLLKGVIQHVDFYEVTFGQLVRTRVKVELTGTPFGCRAGGVLDQIIHDLEIECYPRNLPSAIKKDVTEMQINDVLRVSELDIPAEVKVLSDMDATVASVRYVKEEAPAAPEAADAAAAATTADAASATPASEGK